MSPEANGRYGKNCQRFGSTVQLIEIQTGSQNETKKNSCWSLLQVFLKRNF